MEPDSIVVEVVQDSKTELVSFSIVWLWSSCSSGVGPVDIVISPSRRPTNASPTNVASSPEVSLTLPADQTKELPLLGTAVNTDGSHTTGPAEGSTLTLGKLFTAKSPADQVIPAIE